MFKPGDKLRYLGYWSTALAANQICTFKKYDRSKEFLMVKEDGYYYNASAFKLHSKADWLDDLKVDIAT